MHVGYVQDLVETLLRLRALSNRVSRKAEFLHIMTSYSIDIKKKISPLLLLSDPVSIYL